MRKATSGSHNDRMRRKYAVAHQVAHIPWWKRILMSMVNFAYNADL